MDDQSVDADDKSFLHYMLQLKQSPGEPCDSTFGPKMQTGLDEQIKQSPGSSSKAVTDDEAVGSGDGASWDDEAANSGDGASSDDEPTGSDDGASSDDETAGSGDGASLDGKAAGSGDGASSDGEAAGSGDGASSDDEAAGSSDGASSDVGEPEEGVILPDEIIKIEKPQEGYPPHDRPEPENSLKNQEPSEETEISKELPQQEEAVNEALKTSISGRTANTQESRFRPIFPKSDVRPVVIFQICSNKADKKSIEKQQPVLRRKLRQRATLDTTLDAAHQQVPGHQSVTERDQFEHSNSITRHGKAKGTVGDIADQGMAIVRVGTTRSGRSRRRRCRGEDKPITSEPCDVTEGVDRKQTHNKSRKRMPANEKHLEKKKVPCKRSKETKKKDDSETETDTEQNRVFTRNVIQPFVKWADPRKMRKYYDHICKVCYSFHSYEAVSCPLSSPACVVPNDPASFFGHELPHNIYLNFSRVYPIRLSLFAHNRIPKLTQFGPLIGRKVSAEELANLRVPDVDLDHFWPIRVAEYNIYDHVTVDEYLDTSDVASSNWLRFLLPEHASSVEVHDESPLKFNIQRILMGDDIYFITTRDIKQGDELFLRCMEPPERVFFNLIPRYRSSYAELDMIKKSLSCCLHCTAFSKQAEVDGEPLFQNLLTLVRHHRMGHNTVPSVFKMARIYQCSFCGEEFDNLSQVQSHRNDAHLAESPALSYQCKYCKLYFKSMPRLTAHTAYKHSNEKRREHMCSICGECFESSNKLSSHRYNMHLHDKVEDRTCKFCNKELKNCKALEGHIKKIHKKTGRQMCEVCGRDFSDKYQLRVHSLTHSGIKPFQCDVDGCTAAFTTKQWLQKHYRSAHSFTDDNMPEIRRKVMFSNFKEKAMSKTNSPSKSPSKGSCNKSESQSDSSAQGHVIGSDHPANQSTASGSASAGAMSSAPAQGGYHSEYSRVSHDPSCVTSLQSGGYGPMTTQNQQTIPVQFNASPLAQAGLPTAASSDLRHQSSALPDTVHPNLYQTSFFPRNIYIYYCGCDVMVRPITTNK